MADLVKCKKIVFNSVTELWSDARAWRHLVKPFSNLNPVFNVKNMEKGVMFLYSFDIENASRGVNAFLEQRDMIMSDLISSSKKSMSLANQAVYEINSVNFASLSNESVFKVYSLFMDIRTDLMKNIAVSELSRILNSSIHSDFDSYLSSEGISINNMNSMSSKIFDNRLFSEIGRRIYKRKEEVLLMTPEEIYVSLYNGVFDESEIEERKTHFILVYDLEKDAPHIYSGEKSRVMEASLKIKI
jgi:hypothetical protein